MSGAIGSKTMTYHVIGADGVVKRSERFEAPYAAMVHDFAVTRDYVLFPVFPLTFDLDRMGKIGLFCPCDPNQRSGEIRGTKHSPA